MSDFSCVWFIQYFAYEFDSLDIKWKLQKLFSKKNEILHQMKRYKNSQNISGLGWNIL